MPKYKPIQPVKYDRRTHNISFKNAWNGIRLAFDTQPNFRIHVLFFVLANIASLLYKINITEYLAIVLVSGLVFTMEMINTVVEALGDEIAGGKYNKLVGVAKDISAGGVLISTFSAIAVGLIIFVPKLLALF